MDGVFDSLLIYANALNKTLRMDENSEIVENQTIYGNEIINNVWGMRFKGT